MKTYTQSELEDILTLHQKWLNGEVGGVRADLSYTDLRYLDFRNTEISGINFSYSDLRFANLRGVKAYYCNFTRADLRNTYMRFVDIDGSDLTYTKFGCKTVKERVSKSISMYVYL